METVSQPGEQTGFGRRKIDTRHADLGKSELERPPAHLRQQQRTIELTAVEHHAPIVGTPSRQVFWRNEDETRAFAARLATKPGLAQAFITLHGDLGAGKTTLVRHLLRALGVQGRIKSPTYAVVEPHEAKGLAIWHFDFYRFDDPREWEDAGFRDIFAGPGLKLAEWPEKAAAVLPVADLAIDIEPQTDESRRVTLTAHTHRGQELLA
jgi:tRNA threonylcarbamoyladenosine biosynthesis protein TsaE